MTSSLGEGVAISYVLDASALLAVVHEEEGGSFVETVLGRSAISSVNWSEVVQKALARGLNLARRHDLLSIGLTVVPFDRESAERTAEIWSRASHLSLADRACLALAARLGVPAVTADRAWATLDLAVEVRLIR